MGAALLPAKRLRELEYQLVTLQATTEICMVIENRDTGARERIGGMWDNVRRAYIGPLPPDAKPRRKFFFYDKQFRILLEIIQSYEDNRTAEIPVQDIILTAGRRAGKSATAAGIAEILCILYPGAAVMVIGKRKKHGRKIIEQIRRNLKHDVCHYDKENVKLIFANHSYIETSASDLAGNYNIGDKYHINIFDEGAAMKSETYDYMAPSTVDWNGLNIIPTTQRGLGWVWDKIRQAKDPDPYKSKPIRVYEMSALDNTFLSEAARRRLENLRHTLSARAFASEVLGLALPEGGMALPDWDADNVVMPGPLPDERNSTGLLSTHLFCFNPKRRGEWERKKAWVGVDFNAAHPNWGIVYQFDEIGAPVAIGEYSLTGSTDQFGHGLQSYLSSEFGWGVHDVVLVCDGSGSWQSASGKRTAKFNPSFAALEAQGWFVTTPNASGKRANPYRWQRLEVARTLCKTGTGIRHLRIAKNCTNLIQAFEELDMDAKRYIANLASPWIHIYDAATYPLFRLWGTTAGVRFYKQALVTLLKEDAAIEEKDG